MNIVYEYVNVSASDRLEALIQEKFDALKTRFSFIHRGDVFLKLDNKDHGKKHHCGIRVSLPGPRLYASSDEGNFEEAIAETFRDLKDQLKKKKATMKPHL